MEQKKNKTNLIVTIVIVVVVAFVIAALVFVMTQTKGKNPKDMNRDDLFGVIVPIETALAEKSVQDPTFEATCASDFVTPNKGSISICGITAQYTVEDPDGVLVVLDENNRIAAGTKVRYQNTTYTLDENGNFHHD